MRLETVLKVLCLIAAIAPLARPEAAAGSRAAPQPIEWPTHLYDDRLTVEPLSETDRRFADAFPGAIRKFRTEDAQVVFRWVTQPTRKLHPAADCYRGSGFDVHHRPLRVDRDRHRWGCFDADRGAEQVRVCERVFDRFGNEFTDTSAWYWNAVFGRSVGPWWAVTVVEGR